MENESKCFPVLYYKVVEVWCRYPWQSEIDRRYCIFSPSKKKFHKSIIKGLELDSNSSIEDKIQQLSNLGFITNKLIKL